nr:MAG TPA: KTSC domain [Caudoviricetes sp.]
MKLISVDSSNVDSIGYEDGVIEVHFHNGYAYRYPGCSERLFHEFLNAPSNRFFRSYPFKRYRRGPYPLIPIILKWNRALPWTALPLLRL